MAIRFGMPSLGHTMESGRIVEWLKQEGDPLRKGELLLVIETDKVVTEVEAPSDGQLAKIVVPAEEERPIGATLALLAAPGETLDETEMARLLAQDPARPSAEAAAPVRPAAAAPAPHPAGERVRISPVARKLARQHGIDPATLTGTGPRGRITKEDILRAAEALAAAAAGTASAAVSSVPRPSVSETLPLTGIRGRVAARMTQSWNQIPQVTEILQVDMSASVAYRESRLEKWQGQVGLRVTLNDLITRAVAVALDRHPRINATLVDQEIRVHDRVNLGVAVNLDEGLVVPVIRDADQKEVGQIAQETRELAEKARSEGLQLEDLSDATFTITNLGGAGVELFTPIINPPQVAILGVGKIGPRPLVVEDELQIRQSAYLCLVFDHRALDGVPAARFLQELERLFANPQEYAC